MLKNIKKIALSLLVVGLALGVQSFTNKSNALATIYYQTTEGNYSDTQPVPTPNLCQISSINPCIVTFGQDLPQSEFTIDELPDLLEQYDGEASSNLSRSLN